MHYKNGETDMTFGKVPVCIACIHKHTLGEACDAYPNGIPDDITLGGENHQIPRGDEVDGIVFEQDPSKPIPPQHEIVLGFLSREPTDEMIKAFYDMVMQDEEK